MLEEDVNTEVFSTFTSFKSTQNFLEQFEDSDELFGEQDVTEDDEVSWWEQGETMPNWLMVSIIVLAVALCALSIYVVVQMKRNKETREL